MLTATETRAFQKKLKEMAGRLKGDCSQLEGEAAGGQITTQVPMDGPRQTHEGSAISEAGVTLTLLANEQHLIDEINAAIGRIDDGTFGRCESCGERITKTRLRALPYARCCSGCAKAQDAPGTP